MDPDHIALRSTMRRTGLLLTPSMPERSSTFSAMPPQPSWRILLDDVADPHLALSGVRLVEHPLLPAPFAGDAHEP